MNLVIDIGNTIAKFAAFDEETIVEVVYDSNETLEQLPAFTQKYIFDKAIIATVIDLGIVALQRLESLNCSLLWLDDKTPAPVENLYETPKTLGSDRLAAVVGANGLFPDRDILIIDAGTCITYEFVDALGCYHGGNISPGMQMRFKSLHEFTNRLPLVGPDGDAPFIGKSTETAICAGVLRGIVYEISGYITAMRYNYPELWFF